MRGLHWSRLPIRQRGRTKTLPYKLGKRALLIATICACLAACESLQATHTAESPPPSLTSTAIPDTPTPTPSAAPTVAIRPVVADEPIPTSTPACENAPDTRLIVRELGQVSDEDERPLNVRSGPGTQYRILGRLEVLDVFLVLEGPSCGGGYVWYRIQRGELVGWIAEGDFGIYYVRPYFPG